MSDSDYDEYAAAVEDSGEDINTKVEEEEEELSDNDENVAVADNDDDDDTYIVMNKSFRTKDLQKYSNCLVKMSDYPPAQLGYIDKMKEVWAELPVGRIVQGLEPEYTDFDMADEVANSPTMQALALSGQQLVEKPELLDTIGMPIWAFGDKAKAARNIINDMVMWPPLPLPAGAPIEERTGKLDNKYNGIAVNCSTGKYTYFRWDTSGFAWEITAKDTRKILTSLLHKKELSNIRQGLQQNGYVYDFVLESPYDMDIPSPKCNRRFRLLLGLPPAICRGLDQSLEKELAAATAAKEAANPAPLLEGNPLGEKGEPSASVLAKHSKMEKVARGAVRATPKAASRKRAAPEPKAVAAESKAEPAPKAARGPGRPSKAEKKRPGRPPAEAAATEEAPVAPPPPAKKRAKASGLGAAAPKPATKPAAAAKPKAEPKSSAPSLLDAFDDDDEEEEDKPVAAEPKRNVVTITIDLDRVYDPSVESDDLSNWVAYMRQDESLATAFEKTNVFAGNDPDKLLKGEAPINIPAKKAQIMYVGGYAMLRNFYPELFAEKE